MDDIAATAPRSRRTPAVALVGAGLVAGVVLAGLTAATAQSGPTPAPSAEATAAPDGKPGDKADRKADGRKLRPGTIGGKHLGGMGRGALHGEFVTKDPDGEGYRTMAVQRGEATAVSPTSITVRSEDGFSRTYAVGDDTLVNAGDEGIGDVSTGDQVHVVAVVTDGTARAIRVVDTTRVGEWRQRHHPRGPKQDAEPTPSGTA